MVITKITGLRSLERLHLLNCFILCEFLAACGSAQFSYQSPWWGGADGTLTIYFPYGASNGWTASMTFSFAITGLKV